MTDDLPDDACNPRRELDALERAHLLIANEAAARILDHQSEIKRLRAVQFEHRAAAKQIRALAEVSDARSLRGIRARYHRGTRERWHRQGAPEGHTDGSSHRTADCCTG